MKTNGGYEIKEFEKLSIPKERSNLKPFIYKGIIFLEENIPFDIYWDEDGKCANWQRPDCFININDIQIKKNINKLK